MLKDSINFISSNYTSIVGASYILEKLGQFDLDYDGTHHGTFRTYFELSEDD
ncbi:MAG: hypothetical protein OEQ53_11045 [Saprospiraceae bacterium]|nr:hypothetical protein [Saprospiraceae bacterium]